ncbi:MAG: proton-conducting transporter membrane subunit [Roseivirga sp.]
MNHASVLQSVLDNLASLTLLLPELLIAFTLVAVLVLTLLLSDYQRYWLRPVALLGLSLALYSKYQLSQLPEVHSALLLCNQLLVLDPLALFFCLLLISITWLTLLLDAAETKPLWCPEQVVLILGGLLGACLLVMAHHWLTVYLGLTLLALVSALLVTSTATPQGAEAGLKYLLYSMVTTALMLWGLAYLYAFTGTLSLTPEAWKAGLQMIPGPVWWVSWGLALSNVFFVLSAVPYHFVLPDVYQGASAPVLAYLSTVPRLAAVGVLLRLFGEYLLVLGPVLQAQAQHGLAVLALLTIVLGNAAALRQSHLQRLMAYAAMGHSGLLMAGIAAWPVHPAGLLYYSAVYGAMSFTAWVGIKLLQQRQGGGTHLQDYAGLGWRFPVLGSCITWVMLALIGLPPTAGFTGKWLIFTALWAHWHATGSGLFAVLLLASLLSTLLSLYYYLQLPYALFCSAPQPHAAAKRTSQAEIVMLVVLSGLLFLAFLAAGSLLELLQCLLQ